MGRGLRAERGPHVWWPGEAGAIEAATQTCRRFVWAARGHPVQRAAGGQQGLRAGDQEWKWLAHTSLLRSRGRWWVTAQETKTEVQRAAFAWRD